MDDDKADRGAGMSIDAVLVRELAELLTETNLSEIEVADGDRRIRVARILAAPAPAPAAQGTLAAAAPTIAPAEPLSSAPTAVAPAGRSVKSPMVGTAYLCSAPEAPPFVAVGQSVKAGETLLIIEAMKVMNPITAPVAGTITGVLIDNAQPVEYDQPLVTIG